MTDSKPSKSARKRQQLELQQLGEQLIALDEAELATFDLDERICDAVRQARTIGSRSALRRQRQYIGKLMRDLDPEPVRAGLEALRADAARDKRTFASAEAWRDRLVRERGEGLRAFADETGREDDRLRLLLADLDTARSEKDEKTVRRNIFRRVHELLS